MKNIILFKAIVGSQAYGTNISTSDIDTKGIYIQNTNDIFGFNYEPQIEIDKDNIMFEIKRFLELAMTGNPTMLELLYSPEKCILEKHELFDIIFKHRDIFLSKQCFNSFVGYAKQQISKAKGLNKKINWEKDKITRKTPLDFMKVISNETTSLSQFLKTFDMKPQYCGLVKIDNTEHLYRLYYDYVQAMRDDDIDNPRWKNIPNLKYKGICNDDTVLLSEVSKYNISRQSAIVYYNTNSFQTHCKDYLLYQNWLKERNTTRYIETKEHGQTIDGKNLMHCYRLLNTAKEIVTQKTINVFRPDAEYLLKIRRGKVSLTQLIEQSNEIIKEIEILFNNSDLPDTVDKNKVNDILIEIRQKATLLFK